MATKVLIFILLSSLCFAQIQQQHLSVVAKKNSGDPYLRQLIGYWALEDSTDSYGSNNLTNNGIDFVAGKVNNGGDFTAAGQVDYMWITDNADLSIGSTSFTIACWVNFENPTADYIGLVSKDFSGDRDYMLYFDRISFAQDNIAFVVSNDGSATTFINDETIISNGTWYFVVGWYNISKDSIYIQINNGTIYQKSYAAKIVHDGNSEFQLGRFSNSDTWGLDGILDEVALWKRVLTPAERTYLYNSGSGRTFTGGTIQ